MANKKEKQGVALLHLKDKFAYGSTNGSEMSEFKFDEIQIATLFEFLRKGAFEGMFNFVTLEDAKGILNINYLNLAREAVSTQEIKEIEQKSIKKEQELLEKYEMFQKSQTTGSQPQ